MNFITADRLSENDCIALGISVHGSFTNNKSKGYIIEDPYGNTVGIVKFANGKLGTLSFLDLEFEKNDLSLDQILSTFKFIK